MTIQALDHVNIRSADMPATLSFYSEVLGLDVRAIPGAESMDFGAWVYDPTGRPIVHIGHVDHAFPADEELAIPPASEREPGGGLVDHIAFNCTDHAATRERIAASGLRFADNDVPMARLKQIFVHDPSRVLIELNFREG